MAPILRHNATGLSSDRGVGGGRGVLNKVFYGKAPPQGPTPYPFYHFCQKRVFLSYAS